MLKVFHLIRLIQSICLITPVKYSQSLMFQMMSILNRTLKMLIYLKPDQLWRQVVSIW